MSLVMKHGYFSHILVPIFYITASSPKTAIHHRHISRIIYKLNADKENELNINNNPLTRKLQKKPNLEL